VISAQKVLLWPMTLVAVEAEAVEAVAVVDAVEAATSHKHT